MVNLLLSCCNVLRVDIYELGVLITYLVLISRLCLDACNIRLSRY